MIRFPMMMVVLLVSGSAMAAQSPLLSLTQTNGPVNPRFKSTTACEIFADKVVIITRGGLGTNVPRERQVAYTTTFADAQALKASIEVAFQGQVVRLPSGPVGGGSQSYVAFRKGKEKALKTTGFQRVQNKTAAAKALVRFVDFNCKDQ